MWRKVFARLKVLDGTGTRVTVLKVKAHSALTNWYAIGNAMADAAAKIGLTLHAKDLPREGEAAAMKFIQMAAARHAARVGLATHLDGLDNREWSAAPRRGGSGGPTHARKCMEHVVVKLRRGVFR